MLIYSHSYKYPIWVYAYIFISSKAKKYSFIKSKTKTQYFCYPLLQNVWLLSQKVKGHQAFNLYQLLFSCRASQVALPSKQGHVSPKALASTIPLLQWMESLPTQGISKESSLATRLQTICSCPFRHTEIINQEEVIEHMEICSGTDQEPEVQKLICPYCQQTFNIYDKIDNHIRIHIKRQISNLHNLSQ